MKNSLLEHIAEARVSYELHRAGFLVAKPKPDLTGTDLLVFSEMQDGVKFCRIQCKGRSLVSSPKSNIKIPRRYVSNGSIAILYLQISQNENRMYCFFPSDICQWHLTSKNRYQLSLSRSNVREKLDFYNFDETKVDLIRLLIRNAETSGEFHTLVYGKAEVKLAPPRVSGSGVVNYDT